MEERHAFRRLVSVIQRYKNQTKRVGIVQISSSHQNVACSCNDIADRRLTTINDSFTECLVLGLWCLTPLSNISVISWRSVLVVEETGGPGENHRLVASH